jgi:hypothetical protein
VKSKRILSLLGIVNLYKCRPSEVMGIDDLYTAYCFDEACTFIIRMIEDGNEPVFRKKVKSFSELYADYK